jgi:hypothetical protein
MIQGIRDKLVAITGASKRRSGILNEARPTSEDDTATTFELFFDLVYVFAATQVTGYTLRAHDALGVLQGLLDLVIRPARFTTIPPQLRGGLRRSVAVHGGRCHPKTA